MVFVETELKGAFLIRLDKIEDERGFNARLWCAGEFEAHGLMPRVVQTNIIYNRRKGTLRGLHYQEPPFAECKLFRCIKGAMHDVIIDLRRESPTYRKSLAVELSAARYELLYVPERFAQGFQTLEDDTELIYQVSQFYTPASGHGIRYDDPAFSIEWPLDVSVISAQDRAWPDFDAVTNLAYDTMTEQR
jgi:dTDP-4-dehydrorhamnose 3,5-epimerase